MTQANRCQAAFAALCDTPREGDGIDPRYETRGRHRKPRQRKDYQLCKEAQRILALVLAGETAHPLLRELQIVSVEPEGDGRQLCVTVAHGEPSVCGDAEILAALAGAQGYLRSVLACSIHRKRVPVLRFQYLRKGG
ncbi:MAG: ribosome-binding factor A [Gammaproteobacteria bacterium]